MSQHDPIQLLLRGLETGGRTCMDKCCLATDLLATKINVIPAHAVIGPGIFDPV